MLPRAAVSKWYAFEVYVLLAGWKAFDQIFRHACTTLYHPQSSESIVHHDVYKRVNVHTLEFSSFSYFLVNKHKYFPIPVHIGGNKPSALIPSRFLYAFYCIYARICVHTHIAHTNRICVSIYHSNTERIREPAVDLLLLAHAIAKICSRQKKECLSIWVFYMLCAV